MYDWYESSTIVAINWFRVSRFSPPSAPGSGFGLGVDGVPVVGGGFGVAALPVVLGAGGVVAAV